jgi:hypothetical protein
MNKELLKKVLADLIKKETIIKLVAGILIGIAASYLGMTETELKNIIMEKPTAEVPAPVQLEQ